LGDKAPARQGVKTPEHLDIPSFRTGSRTGFIGVQNVKLFLSELLRRLSVETPAIRLNSEEK